MATNRFWFSGGCGYLCRSTVFVVVICHWFLFDVEMMTCCSPTALWFAWNALLSLIIALSSQLVALLNSFQLCSISYCMRHCLIVCGGRHYYLFAPLYHRQYQSLNLRRRCINPVIDWLIDERSRKLRTVFPCSHCLRLVMVSVWNINQSIN